MKERFDGFVSGRLYTFDRIIPPDRVQFLWFEISLLLCLLTADLESASDPEDYWKHIVPPLLTQLSSGITDARMNEIMTAARGYRDKWMMHEHDGPLGKILDAPMLAAFDCDYDDERYPEVLRLCATKILEDNADFINKYRGIVDPERAPDNFIGERIQWNRNPGRFERYLQIRYNNPLFQSERRKVEPRELLAARERDTEEHKGFQAEMKSYLDEIVSDFHPTQPAAYAQCDENRV